MDDRLSIAGVAIACVAFVLIIVALVIWLLKKPSTTVVERTIIEEVDPPSTGGLARVADDDGNDWDNWEW
jgi:Na+-transporting methylmalonyl-CoA/oxaloacetate decarboxylase gamma subunit